MTEIEQLRAEINELRERVAVLERVRHHRWEYVPMPFVPGTPYVPNPTPWPGPEWAPPTVTC